MDLTYPEKYHKAAAYFDYLFGNIEEANTLSSARKLLFYALRCQAEHGACTAPAPSRWHRNEWYKHNAWKKLASMSREEAMVHFVNELEIELEEYFTLPEVRATLPLPIRWADVQIPSVSNKENDSVNVNVCNEIKSSVNKNNEEDVENWIVTQSETEQMAESNSNPTHFDDNNNINNHANLSNDSVNNVTDNTYIDNQSTENNMYENHADTNANSNTSVSATITQKMFNQEEEQEHTYNHNKIEDNTALVSSANHTNAINEVLSHTDVCYEFDKWDKDVREHCDVSQANIYYLAAELMQARWANRRLLATIQNLHDELDERNWRISSDNSERSNINHTNPLTHELLPSYIHRSRHVAISTEQLVIKTIQPFSQTQGLETCISTSMHEQEKKITDDHEQCNIIEQQTLQLENRNVEKPKKMTLTDKEQNNFSSKNNLTCEQLSQLNNLTKNDNRPESEFANSNVSPAEQDAAHIASSVCDPVADTQNEPHEECGGNQINEGDTTEFTNDKENKQYECCDQEYQGLRNEVNEDKVQSSEQMKELLESTPATKTQE